MNAAERLSALVDKDSYRDIDGLDVDLEKGIPEITVRNADGVLAGTASVAGRRVVVLGQISSYMGGSVGKKHARRIKDAVARAIELRCPVIGFYESGGARVQEGVGSLVETAKALKQMTLAKGKVPILGVVAGAVSGGSAYIASLSDLLVMLKGRGSMFVWGPGSVKAELGTEVTAEELGGWKIHASNGSVELLARHEVECVDLVKRAIGYMLRAESKEPRIVHRGAGARNAIESLVDRGSFFELQKFNAGNVITCFARLNGEGIGVVATNKRVRKGFLDVGATKKIVRFVSMCNSMDLPVITILDTPGFYPSPEQEKEGLIEESVKLADVYSKESPPKVTVVTGEAYGGAFVFFASKSLGISRVYTTPTARLSVLGLAQYIETFVRRKVERMSGRKREEEYNRMVNEYARQMDPLLAATHGYIDGIVRPHEIRKTVAKALSELRTG